MTQRDAILDYMKRYGSITPLEALSDLSCMRLAARIAELRHKGLLIDSTTVHRTNRFGADVHFSRYELHRDAELELGV